MTIRDQVLNLHNQGLKPEEIVAALSTQKSPITKGEILTKIAQCRREGLTVRPDDADPAVWCRNTRPKEPQKEVNLIEFVKAWNKNPVSRIIAAKFGISVHELNRLLSHLRGKGVPLLPIKRKYDFAALREAALSVLSEEQKAQFVKPAKLLSLKAQDPQLKTGEAHA